MEISVIIPTYNRAFRLRNALRSIYAQTLKPMEVLVIDDGSTDETGEMIKSEFPQVRYIPTKSKGVSHARNVGIRASRGQWIALLDSDDEWLPGKLAAQVELIKRNPGYRICHTEEIWIRHGVRVNQMDKHRKSGGRIFQDCLPLCVISPSSVMIERSLLKDVGLFDEKLIVCEDYDLWLRICAREPVLFVEEPLITKYGGHDDQLSQQHWGMDRFRIKALEKIIRHGRLDHEDRQAAIEVLIEKSRIMANGSEKRGKMEQANHYRQLINYHQAIC